MHACVLVRYIYKTSWKLFVCVCVYGSFLSFVICHFSSVITTAVAAAVVVVAVEKEWFDIV